jgi:hypothetical protein
VVTVIELTAIINASAQAGQIDAENKTSVESTAQDDDFRDGKRRKRQISIDTSQAAKNSTKPVPTYAAVKLPRKTVLTRKIFASLRTTDMNTEITGAENTLQEQEAPRYPCRSPLVVMTSTSKLIQLQKELKEHVKGEYEI